jgi:hypothetical protein
MRHKSENHDEIRRALLTAGVRLLQRCKRPTATYEFYAYLYSTLLGLDEAIDYKTWTRTWAKIISAEVSRWRAKGWLSGDTKTVFYLGRTEAS